MFRVFLVSFIVSLSCAAIPASANLNVPVALEPSASIDNVIDRAHELLGTPYKSGGNKVDQGFDCSSFMVYLFKTEANIRLPRTTTEMHRSSAVTVQREALKPGDAVFFNGNGRGQVSHVGLYIGKGKFIHSPSTGKRVRIDSLSNSYWKKHYTTAKRFHAAG
ncbi:C40 family peptidase [Pseudomonas fluorescens]|uniref:C40 family peptidase n=1 Tax=Pseudomonas fluorescens TaxID=294 RepID=UPI001907E566|nr:C40 family peptidase [Pseudomonas fluorescens]MBD8091379.1 C40 family peptidase [Pseudomonas fluorescens]MBD8717952.1 C40 family peptidase [Pseudomonas fluorescens]